MQLHFKKSGSGEPIIILHGLFGMLDNWQTVSKELEKYLTVYGIDQRNHGKSTHSIQHSYQLMSEDLLEFMQEELIESAIILGHSMGAKTAIRFAFDHGNHVRKLILVDMGIKAYPPSHEYLFNVLLSVPLPQINNRSEVEEILNKKIRDQATKLFMMKNLTRNSEGKYSWKFNLETLYHEYHPEILSPIISSHPFQKETLFIRGEKSDYIIDEDWPHLQEYFPNSSLKTIKGASHWVHADAPEIFIKTVKEFLHL